MDKKQCPYCGEEIMATAKKCRFCGEWLEEQKSDSSASTHLHNNTSPTNSVYSTRQGSVSEEVVQPPVYYSMQVLIILLVVGMVGAVMQSVIFFAPEWTFSSICDYSLYGFNAFDSMSSILLALVEIVFVLMARDKIVKEQWGGNLSLWLLIYSITTGFIVLLGIIGIFTFEPYEFEESIPSDLRIIFALPLLFPEIYVGCLFLGKEITSRIGWATIASVVVCILVLIFEPEVNISPSGKTEMKLMVIALLGVPYYLFSSYLDFLSGRRVLEIEKEKINAEQWEKKKREYEARLKEEKNNSSND
ncbi:MAG: zinc ribbon domain-containing protein [Muribaculaceae bacterium]|nr:zinc ribbon domain-containing protein [Muribaculaceae bacterium]